MLGVERKAARLAMQLTSCEESRESVHWCTGLCLGCAHNVSCTKRHLCDAEHSLLGVPVLVELGFLRVPEGYQQDQEGLKQQLHLRGKAVTLQRSRHLT